MKGEIGITSGDEYNIYKLTKVIESETPVLTPKDIQMHRAQVEASQLKELLSWHNLGSWILVQRATSSGNSLTARKP